ETHYRNRAPRAHFRGEHAGQRIDVRLRARSGRVREGNMSEKTILVADDESHILHVVSLKLRNAGFNVLTARDGAEALEMAQQQHPDLLITDCHMPQLSGLELCQRLKQDARTSDIPAIMLTARGYHLEPH